VIESRLTPVASTTSVVARAVLVTAGIVALFGGLLPMLVMHLHWQLAIAELYFAPLRNVGLVVMAISVGCFSGTAVTLAAFGRGSPIWFQAPRRLVLVGPYAHTRNPMALAAMGHGIGLTLYSGSLLIVGYVTLGTLWWAIVARPRETADLARRFGREYESWVRHVPLLFPRLSSYRPLDDAPTRTLVADGAGRSPRSGRRRRH
jgi:protein-S-isoprenylcysteine O-methyltransferase Ste14